MRKAFICFEIILIAALIVAGLLQSKWLDDDEKAFRLADYIIAEQYSEIHACEHAGQDTNYHGSGL